MTTFAKLHPDGTLTNVREIKQSAIQRCPHYIFVADHYREDGSCRCNDRNDPNMREWGYRWSRKLKRWA